MTSKFIVLTAVAAMAALLPGTPLHGQNPLPNSPPSAVVRNPPLGSAGSSAPARDADRSADSVPVNGAPSAPNPVVPSVSGDYILVASDTLEMSIFNEPSLTTQTRVSADGTVQFPLIGEIKVGGMPIRDARELIRKRYNADYLVEPQVYLNVVSYAQHRYTVLGQVNRPGTYDFPGGSHLGLMEAIGQAGGFTRLANESKVQVKRSSAGSDQNFSVNTKKLVTRDGKPFDLAPGDVITVTESWF